MDGATDAAEFWEDPGLVDDYASRPGALPYEVDLVERAARTAGRSGPLGRVHVVGVGAGRELAAIRAAAPDAAISAWDISAAMVTACRAAVAAAGWEDVEVGRADAAQISPTSAGEPADAVVALGAVLGYCTTGEQRQATLANLARLLRPGGSIALVVQQRRGRPDWALWFAVRRLRDLLPGRSLGAGNRLSRHGDSEVLFHHYRPAELTELLIGAGFGDVEACSLRSWARAHDEQLPWRSPNPLMVTAARRS